MLSAGAKPEPPEDAECCSDQSLVPRYADLDSDEVLGWICEECGEEFA